MAQGNEAKGDDLELTGAQLEALINFVSDPLDERPPDPTEDTFEALFAWLAHHTLLKDVWYLAADVGTPRRFLEDGRWVRNDRRKIIWREHGTKVERRYEWRPNQRWT